MNCFSVPRRTALMMALTAGAFGQVPALAPLDENEAALMQVFLRANPLGDGLSVFPSGTSGLVPLGEISRLLLFPIAVNAKAGRAQGFFIHPKRTFSLDLDAHSVVSEGRHLPFKPGQVRRHGQELYVDARLLETWFPIHVKLEFRDSSVYISSKEPLPIEEAWKRDQLNARLLTKRPGDPDSKGPSLEHPYQALTLPMADLSVSFQRASGGAGSSPQGSANLGGDLLWMSSQIYLTRDGQGSFESSRATLYRDDPSGGMLGPMHARHISLGDLQRGASLDLAGGLPQGRGLGVDNHSMDFRTSFATRVFRGPLAIGWSVELFQNGGLVAYQQARPDATFELPPVNLTFGLNNFKLVYHGPHGERREENIRLDISQDQPEPGAFYYRLAAVRPNLQAATSATSVRLLERPAFLADAEYGLTSRFSAQGGLMRLQYSDGNRTYGVAGVRGILPWLSLDVLGAASRFTSSDGADARTGGAGQFTLRTGIGYSSLTAIHSEYRNGFLPVQEVTTSRLSPLRTDDSLTLASSTQFARIPLSASLTYRRLGFVSGWQESQRLMVGTTLGRVAFSQSIGITAETSPTGQVTRSQDAQLLLSSSVGPYCFQGEVTGRKNQGGFQMENYAGNLTRVFNSGLSLQATLRGNFHGGGTPSLTASLMQQKGRLGWSLDGSYNKSGGSSIGVRLQVSVGRDPRSRRWFTDAQPQASMGAVSARAFLDANGNGQRDAGERLLEEARFRVGDTSRPEIRADAHTALYTGVGAGRNIQISLDGASLEDSSLQPRVPSYTILPRAGVVTPVDYPVVVLGEAMGTCRVRRGKRLEEMPGVLVELVDATGRMVQSQRSAFDGFFEFRNLPLGKYQLRVPQSEVDRLNLRAQPARAVDLTLGRAFVEGQDLVIEYLQQVSEPEVAPAKPPEPDPAHVPRIHVFPWLDPQQTRSVDSLAPFLQPIFPRPGSLSSLPTRLDPAPGSAAPAASKARVQVGPSARFRGIRHPHKPVAPRALQNPKPSPAAESHAIHRAVTALTFGEYFPWSDEMMGPARHRAEANPESALTPMDAGILSSRPASLPDTWTLLLLTARHPSTVELVRRRLGFQGKELFVHTTTPGDPMRLLLGRYLGRDAAEAALLRIPDMLLCPGTFPSVIPFPIDGVIS